MIPDLTVSIPVSFTRAAKGQLHIAEGAPPPPEPAGRIPKLSRLMALAIRLEGLLGSGDMKDMADVARLGHVTRARVTQILNLRALAPDIQEEILFLPPTEHGRDPIKEWQVRPIAATLDWNKQRKMWAELKARVAGEKR